MRIPRPSTWWLAAPLVLLLWAALDRPHHRPVHRAEWLDAGGVAVRTVRAGQGDTTLVLLHGYGESLTTWRAVFDPLASQFRVIALDLPGFGASAKPDVEYSLPAMTDRLARFVEQWAGTDGPLILVGHSMGGQLAAALALALPERIQRVVLIAPAGYRIGLWGVAESMSPGKARAIGRWLALRSFITPIHDPAWLAEPDSAARYDPTTDTSYRRVAARVLEQFDFVALGNRFAGLTQPTLLIWGGLDPVVPFSVADTIAGLIPCARFVALPNAFHRPQAEVPDTVIAEIQRFIRAKAGAGKGCP